MVSYTGIDPEIAPGLWFPAEELYVEQWFDYFKLLYVVSICNEIFLGHVISHVMRSKGLL